MQLRHWLQSTTTHSYRLSNPRIAAQPAPRLGSQVAAILPWALAFLDMSGKKARRGVKIRASCRLGSAATRETWAELACGVQPTPDMRSSARITVPT